MTTNEVEHLLILARRGARGGGATGAEVRAFHIVDTLRRHLYGLDAESLRGLAELTYAMYYEPMATRDEIAAYIGSEADSSDAAGCKPMSTSILI